MKPLVILLALYFSQNTFANWKNNKSVAEQLQLPSAVTSQVTVNTVAPLTLNAGVVPASCYIRQDKKASQDLFFLFYKVSEYKYQFNPEDISIYIDDIPLSHFYADIIKTHFIADEIVTVGANYALNSPFSSLFKKGSVLTVVENKTDDVVAEFNLKNSYRSYVNADHHCRRSYKNVYYLENSTHYMDNTSPKIMPMPQDLLVKLEKQYRNQMGIFWKTGENKNFTRYKDSRIYLMVNNPGYVSSNTFFECRHNMYFALWVNDLNLHENNIANYTYKIISSDKELDLKLTYSNAAISDDQIAYYVYLVLPFYIYQKFKTNTSYKLHILKDGKNILTKDNSFTLGNLADSLQKASKECYQQEAKHNLVAIQENLNGFPRNVNHPNYADNRTNPFNHKNIDEIQKWMKKYKLHNTSTYEALSEAESFYYNNSNCYEIKWDEYNTTQSWQLEEEIKCNKRIADTAAEKGYFLAFESAKSNISHAVNVLKARNSNDGFFSNILQGLVGAAAEIAGMEYGQDFSELSNNINSYIRNDSYMIEMNKHVYDVNQYAENSIKLESSGSSSTSNLRSVNSGSASNFQNALSSSSFSCDGQESQNLQAHLNQSMNEVISKNNGNLCGLSRDSATVLKTLIPYYEQCAPQDLNEIEDQISHLELRANRSCMN